MAFDMGFNFRGTAGYVTDGAEGVPVLGEAYPHTYTNGNGYSINAGFTNAIQAAVDLASGNDARIAGANRIFTDHPPDPVTTFKIDLSSGSAPGAGDYDLDLAEGSATEQRFVDFTVTDTTTMLIDGSAIGNTSAGGKFYDATLTERTASTTWNGVTVSKTFATTEARVNMGVSGIGGWLSYLAHFRLTKGASAYTLALNTAMLTLTGQGVTPRAARLLTAEHAQLAMTGQVAALRAERRLAIAHATLTLAGQSVDLSHGYTMAIDPALLTVAGQDATLRRTAQLLLDRGLLAVAGQAVTLRKSGGAAGYTQRRDTMQPFRRRWSS